MSRDNGQGSPKKPNGPATSATGPFKPGQKPYQYYKYGGGVIALEIFLPQETDWRSLSGTEIPPEVETPGPDNKAPEQQ